MKKRLSACAGAVALLGLWATPGLAFLDLKTSITTKNTTDRAIWVTIYDLGKSRHLDYGCVGAKQAREWRAGNYLEGSYYYARAEIKENGDCRGRTLCDTTVQMNPSSTGSMDGSIKKLSGTIVSLKYAGSCWWDHDN